MFILHESPKMYHGRVGIGQLIFSVKVVANQERDPGAKVFEIIGKHAKPLMDLNLPCLH